MWVGIPRVSDAYRVGAAFEPAHVDGVTGKRRCPRRIRFPPLRCRGSPSRRSSARCAVGWSRGLGVLRDPLAHEVAGESLGTSSGGEQGLERPSARAV